MHHTAARTHQPDSPYLTGKLTQTAEVHSGRRYQSHYGMHLNFGLGEKKKAAILDPNWTFSPSEAGRKHFDLGILCYEAVDLLVETQNLTDSREVCRILALEIDR